MSAVAERWHQPERGQELREQEEGEGPGQEQQKMHIGPEVAQGLGPGLGMGKWSRKGVEEWEENRESDHERRDHQCDECLWPRSPGCCQ